MKQAKWEMVWYYLDPSNPNIDEAIRWARKYFKKPLRPQTSFGIAVIHQLTQIRKMENRQAFEASLVTLRRFIKREGYVRAVSRTQSKYRDNNLKGQISLLIRDAMAKAFQRALLRKQL